MKFLNPLALKSSSIMLMILLTFSEAEVTEKEIKNTLNSTKNLVNDLEDLCKKLENFDFSFLPEVVKNDSSIVELKV